MNKQKFIEFVENPESISAKDAEILTELAHNYPYSSLVHTLLAKASKSTAGARSSLASAALYIPDRSVLKSVMESENGPEAPERDDHPSQNSLVSEQAPVLVSEEIHPATASLAENSFPEKEPETKGDVFNELQENLQKLKDQRERFNNSGTDKEESSFPKETEHPEPSVTDPENEPVKNYSLSERLQEVVESREERIIEDPKRIEQINLIDDFIRNSQSMAKKYRSLNELPEEQSDLTGKYHFTPPDLATENLALIMVRQGKPEKAIDIYEKLVLKYPEKKAYFASCIEKLKNS